MEKLTFTPEEAIEIYYALESKIVSGLAGSDKKWKADIEAIMDKIGVDGVNLLTGNEPEEIPQGEPVPIPEYQINYYPVAYINVDDSGLLDQIEGMLNSCATGDGQFLVSREYLDEQIKSMEEGLDINADEQTALSLSDEEKEAFDFLVKITTKLKNFGGDVWFYAN